MLNGKHELLLARLDAIGSSLDRSNNALALIALGSCGVELERLDNYSDLDFFAVVESGHKNEYLESLEWLSSICPLSYAYRNTRDGFKILFEDGVFCEFAVFETPELRGIPFAPGRFVWKKSGVPDTLCLPEPGMYPRTEHSNEWLAGEVLTNLYVGMSRDGRGEKLSAMRAIQVNAVERVLELAMKLEPETSVARDIYAFDRRFERRYPASSRALPEYIQGYARNAESALAILAFLEAHFEVNPAMKREIVDLCEKDGRV